MYLSLNTQCHWFNCWEVTLCCSIYVGGVQASVNCHKSVYVGYNWNAKDNKGLDRLLVIHGATIVTHHAVKTPVYFAVRSCMDGFTSSSLQTRFWLRIPVEY